MDPQSGFIFSFNPTSLLGTQTHLADIHALFYKNITNALSISISATMDVPNFSISTFMTVPGMESTPCAWRHCTSQSMHLICRNLYDKQQESRNFVYMGFLHLARVFTTAKSIKLSSSDFDSSQSNTFICELVEDCVDIYCCDTLPHCDEWIQRHNNKEFEIAFGAFKLRAQFTSSPCSTCCGIHRNNCCPFVEPRKHRRDGSYDVLQAKRIRSHTGPFRTSQDPVLERTTLVQAIIERVLHDQFLLVSKATIWAYLILY